MNMTRYDICEYLCWKWSLYPWRFFRNRQFMNIVSIVIFSVKYDRHHRILIIRQCIRFAIVNLPFVSYDAKKLMSLILYICLKFDVSIMHNTMKRMCLSSFLSSFWQPYYFVVAIEIFDRHILSYHHIFHQIWLTSSDAIWSVKPLNLQLFSFLFASHD